MKDTATQSTEHTYLHSYGFDRNNIVMPLTERKSGARTFRSKDIFTEAFTPSYEPGSVSSREYNT